MLGKLTVELNGLKTAIFGLLFEYETPKVVAVRSVRIGIINRGVQMCIIGYVVVYAIIFQKGYQEFDTAESIVTTKVKGLMQTRASPSLTNSMQIWDTADYVIPALENGAFFVTTNVVTTPDQFQGVCPEDTHILEAKCETDANCPVGLAVPGGNGIRTGVCNMSTNTCEIAAWCPTEFNEVPKNSFLSGAGNLTVLVKNYILFPKFNLRRRSILSSDTGEYLATCNFHPTTDPLCPVFRLADIAKFAGESFEELAVAGGIIGFMIDWDCDLDKDLTQQCFPQYSFRRVDNRYDLIAKGWNFRYADYWIDTAGASRRTLKKAYGIRFVFYVTGRAGKFNFIPLLTNLGAGLALLSIASICCDFFLLYVVKHKDFYSQHKFQTINSDIKPDQNRHNIMEKSSSFSSNTTATALNDMKDQPEKPSLNSDIFTLDAVT